MKYISELKELDGVKNSLFELKHEYEYLSVISKNGNTVIKINFYNFNELPNYGFYDYKLLKSEYRVDFLEKKLGIVPLYMNGEWMYGKKITDSEVVVIGNLEKKLKENGLNNKFKNI